MEPTAAKEFLNFSKKERRGIFVVLACIALIIAAQYIYPLLIKTPAQDAKDLARQAALLKTKSKDSATGGYNSYEGDNAGYGKYSKRNDQPVFNGTMFYFDPNTLGEDGWRKLGVREKTIGTIKNYLSKAGKFRQPDDIRKIWGLSAEEKDRLVPYVRIADVQKNTSGYTADYRPAYERKPYEKKTIQPVEINNGDSLAFVSLPGIGAGFSRRIINFRNKLGGFYRVEQVAETFGLPDSTYQKIKPFLTINKEAVRKININTCSSEELKSHPYIRWQLANIITEYKKQHGNFKQLDELKNIMLINEELYGKISPYLTL